MPHAEEQTDLPDISTMKLSHLREELNLYGINSSTFCEKSEMITALQHARTTLPRPRTSYRAVEPPPHEDDVVGNEEKAKKHKIPKQSQNVSSSSSSGKFSSSSIPQQQDPSKQSASSSASTTNTTTTTTTTVSAPKSNNNNNNNNNNNGNARKTLASRSPVVVLQRIKEKPSTTTTTTTPNSITTTTIPSPATTTTTGERTHSFLPGSPFSFAIHGSIHDEDAAIIRIPDGICLTIHTASVDAKAMEYYLHQKGALGVSLRLATEENPYFLPLWTFEKEKSTSYQATNLGMRVAGPRSIRLYACMEMGYRSGASVDVYVFGSVTLDGDKFF